MGRWILPMIIGIILAAGAWFWFNNTRNNATIPPEATPVVSTVNINGKSLVISPDNTNRLVIKSEAPQANLPLPVATALPTLPQPTVVGSGVQPTTAPASPMPTPVVATPVLQPTAVPVTAQPTMPSVGRQLINYVDYVVQPGDTMFSISKKPEFNTSIGLMAQTGILSNYIVPGQVIRVPVVNPSGCQSGKAHIVEKGQNVFRLAIKYGTTQEAIRDWNALPSNYLIRTGDILCIP